MLSSWAYTPPPSPLISPFLNGSRVRTPLPLRRQVCPDTEPCAPDKTHPPTCRLYFTTFPHPPPKQETLNDPGFQTEKVNVRGIRTPPSESSEPIKHYYFTIDDQLMYMSFFQDWGPLNVAMVYKACIYIHSLLIVSHSPSYDPTMCGPVPLRPAFRCCVTLRTIRPRPLSKYLSQPLLVQTPWGPWESCTVILTPQHLCLDWITSSVMRRTTGRHSDARLWMLIPRFRTKTLPPTASSFTHPMTPKGRPMPPFS